MELAVLAVLGGAGFLLAKQTAPRSSVVRPKTGGVVRKALERKEGFADPLSPSQINKTSLRGANPQLDLMYNTKFSNQPNSQTSDYAYLPGITQSVPTLSIAPTGTTAATPDVMMNAAGLEESPTYVDGTTVVSGLSGQTMATSDFTHNNMQPYFGSRVRQNVDPNGNNARLDMYNGSGSTTIKKQEMEQMFDNTQVPFGNVYGMEDSSSFIQSRVNDPRNRAGERPFEQIQVAPGVGEGFSSTGKGGFQQFEVNELMAKNLKRTDDLRTVNNPKLSYNMPVVPGQQFIGKSMDNAGEVRKYRPDTFSIDDTGKRFGGGGQEGFQKETTRPIQVFPHVTRPETSVEYQGPGASQDFGMNYVVGSYRKPMGDQFGGAGYRNADGSAYNIASEKDDFGKSSYEVRPNERFFTGDRAQGLNVSPAEAGAVTTHYEDDSRPTRRSETIGNIHQTANATGYAAGAPAITVWDPNDIARTTVKEGTIFLDRFGIAGPGDGPTRLKVYDPDDVARPTQKAQISAKSAYTGGPKAAHERHMSHTFAYNMTLNPSKQEISKGRKLGGGNIQLFAGEEPNVSSKKLDADIINDRALAVNRSLDMGADVSNIGRVKYRAPLKLDIADQRNQREIIEATENNPLMQSLRKNAERDMQLLSN